MTHAPNLSREAISNAPHCKAPSKAPSPILPVVVTALPAMPPIGAVRATCQANCPTLEVLDKGSRSVFTHSIEEAIFSAHALNFSPIGVIMSLMGVHGTSQSIPLPAFLVAKEPILPIHRIAPVTAP